MAIGCVPIAIFLSYLVFVINNTSTFENLGTFGDSFGVINTLFTGLAFAALIINILQQREEIKIQQEDLFESRKQFERTADAQERTARLTAFSELLREYNEKIIILRVQISEEQKNRPKPPATFEIVAMFQNLQPTGHELFLNSELAELLKKKNNIIIELEKSL